MAGDPRTWDDERLAAALDRSSRVGPGWGPIAVLPSTGSTNADAADQVREGAPEGFTVVSDEQTGGRGRLGRAWESPTGAGLAMSVVLRPVVVDRHWGWLPLLAGVAVSDALRDVGVRTFFCGPESFTPDVHPLLGPAPEVQGVHIAAGMNSAWFDRSLNFSWRTSDDAIASPTASARNRQYVM